MISKKLLIELQEYVERHKDTVVFSNLNFNVARNEDRFISEEIQNIEIEDFIKNNRKPKFNQVLFSLIDNKGFTDSDVYKRAGIDRRHFSKIRTNPDYRISKNTAIALALSLELTKKDTNTLLSSAGYSLSDSETFDLVIQFCLEKRIYNLDDVNQALDYFSLRPLSGVLE